jgi:hypothetical protein
MNAILLEQQQTYDDLEKIIQDAKRWNFVLQLNGQIEYANGFIPATNDEVDNLMLHLTL